MSQSLYPVTRESPTSHRHHPGESPMTKVLALLLLLVAGALVFMVYQQRRQKQDVAAVNFEPRPIAQRPDDKLVATAPDKDIAVLQIDAPATKLLPLPVGQSANLKVGQKVLAIGNPFGTLAGLDRTLTTGVISGLGREIKSVTGRPISDVIQT